MLSFACKNHKFCFTFVLVIVNPIVLKITWWEILNLNVLVKLLGISQAMNYFKVSLRFPYHSICEKYKFDTHNIIKESIVFLEFLFLGVWYAKTSIWTQIWLVNSNLLNDNLGHNILRLFNVLPNFSFTTSETNCDY